MSPAQRDIDQSVRLSISRELRHEREQITAVYKDSLSIAVAV